MSANDSSGHLLQQTILDNLNTAVLLLTDQLVIEYINPACENLLHISSRQAIGTQLQKVMLLEESFEKRLLKASEDLHPISEYETSTRLPSGRKLTIDYVLTPLQQPDHSVKVMLEISHMDRHIRIAREEKLLSEQNATRNLVRGMAHEIKNPLGGLRGAAQLLERELHSEELKEYTQIIIGEADRLQALVDRMLGPNSLPMKRNINIHQVLEHVRQLLSAELSDSDHIHFKLDYDPSLPEIMADSNMIIQAVLNITRNAIQALHGEGEITFKTRPLRHFTIGRNHYKLVLQTDIIDNGPGIPEELQEHIFYPMVTGRAEGTGLGLSIAQSLINQHDGLIKMHSQPGKTVFTIYLPISTAVENTHG